MMCRTCTRDVKKQINPSVKAHLLRSALILLSLLAICAIPFARAQSRSREATKRSVASRTDESRLPTRTIGPLGVRAFQMPPVPKLPAVVLYDQLNNPGTFAVSSQEFPDLPASTDFAADDFVVPTGETWNITELDAEGAYLGPGPADNFNVFFYSNSGSLPGPQVYSATAQSYRQQRRRVPSHPYRPCCSHRRHILGLASTYEQYKRSVGLDRANCANELSRGVAKSRRWLWSSFVLPRAWLPNALPELHYLGH